MFNSVHIDLTVDILPDSPEDVTGQDNHKGVLEEVREDEDAGAEEQDKQQADNDTHDNLQIGTNQVFVEG